MAVDVRGVVKTGMVASSGAGFAGQAQGVKVVGRTALLVLLLLAVIPLLDVAGLLGILVTALVRRGSAPSITG